MMSIKLSRRVSTPAVPVWLSTIPLRADLVDRDAALKHSRELSPTCKWEISREILGGRSYTPRTGGRRCSLSLPQPFTAPPFGTG